MDADRYGSLSRELVAWMAEMSADSRTAVSAVVVEPRKPYKQSDKGRAVALFSSAKWRGIEASISPDDLKAIWVMPCHYCGGSLSPSGGGIDRIDNARGYELSNVLPCCGRCNVVRGDKLTVAEMEAVAALLWPPEPVEWIGGGC